MKKRKSAYASAEAKYHKIVRDGKKRVILPLAQARPRRCILTEIVQDGTGELVEHIVLRKIEATANSLRLFTPNSEFSTDAAAEILPEVASTAADAASTAGEGLLDGLSGLFDWISF